jgi:tetratricopeptide (TPR) repeat protein
VRDPVAAGRLLHVRLVLEGTLQRVGDRIRVTARLLNVSDGTSLWTGTFEENFTNVFAVQDTIAQKVTAALALHLTGPEQARLTKRHTESPEAYQLYFKGRFYWDKYTEEGFRKSIECFAQALDKDPAYALAYAGLADSYSLLGAIGFSEPERDAPWHAVASEAFPKARAYAEKALELDETLAEGHLSLGIVKLLYEADARGAEKELRRAKELNPNNPQVYHFYGHYLQLTERFHEAIDEMQQGARLDPTNLIVALEIGTAYCLDRQYDKGIALLRKALELEPSFSEGRRLIATAYIWQGRYEEARAELAQIRGTAANSQAFKATTAFVDAKTGKRADAQKVLEDLIRESADPRAIAWVYISLDEKDHALDALANLEQLDPAVLPWVKIDPGFGSVVSDPRFDAVLWRAKAK